MNSTAQVTVGDVYQNALTMLNHLLNSEDDKVCLEAARLVVEAYRDERMNELADRNWQHFAQHQAAPEGEPPPSPEEPQ